MITLAIPFYNSSRYFLDVIKYTSDNSFVSEIVVNDDFSSDEDYTNLLQVISQLNTDKIKVFRNTENVGAFRNKYLAVQRSTCDWIYLLDSDNHPFENTYDVLSSIKDLNPEICYCPSKLFCKGDGKTEYENISDYNTFKYDIIGIEESKDAIIKRTKWFDWFINSGNYFFNRNSYIEKLKEPFENYNNYKLYADTAASFYFWLRNSGQFKVVSNLHHNHRLRNDSYWHSCGSESQSTVDLYTRMILEL
jgi:hypothetical protein